MGHVVATSPRPYTRPTMTYGGDGDEISLYDARHPLVETLVADYVPNDGVELLSNAPSVLSTLRDAVMRGLPDAERLARKLERQNATLQDLCLLYKVSSAIP